jgi:hypothetical protein
MYILGSWYHPADEFLKLLMLFFDGLSVLLPRREWDRHFMGSDLSSLLVEQGFLQPVDPSIAVSPFVATSLFEEMVALIEGGCFDSARREIENNTYSLTSAGVPILREKFGVGVRPELANLLVGMLTEAGLAGLNKRNPDYVRVPREVGDRILNLLGQIVPPALSGSEVRYHPASKGRALTTLLGAVSAFQASDVIQFDLTTVNANIVDIPLHEILEFKDSHDQELRAYLDSAFSLARSSSSGDAEALARIFHERKKALEEALTDFIGRRSHSIRKQTVVALGLAGAIWTTMHGDPVGGGLAAASVLTGATRKSKQPLTPYAYVVRFGATPASGYRQPTG